MDGPSLNPYAPPSSRAEEPQARATASGEYRPLFGRATAVTVILGLEAAMEVASIIVAVVTIGAMNRILAREEVSQATLEGIDASTRALAVGQFASLIAAAIAFCMLVARANRNARSYEQAHMEFSPGWAVGFFFVPIASLVQPYRAMAEIWRASEPRIEDHPRISLVPLPALLPGWWAAFLLHALCGQVGFYFSKDLHGARDFVARGYVELVSSSVTIVAAVLAIALVRALARRQDACQIAVETRRAQPAA